MKEVELTTTGTTIVVGSGTMTGPLTAVVPVVVVVGACVIDVLDAVVVCTANAKNVSKISTAILPVAASLLAKRRATIPRMDAAMPSLELT